jgi:hypothetical protein
MQMQIKSNKLLKWSYFFLLLCPIIFLETITLSSEKKSINQTSDIKLYKHIASGIHSCAQSSDKIKCLQKMETEVDSWCDGLGLGIDPGIKKMIIVLNLLHFKTEQSCEGHINRGRAYPWVRIIFKDSKLSNLLKENINNSNLIQQKETKIQKKYPKLSLGEAIRKENSQELLEAYKKRYSLSEKIEKILRLKAIQLKNLINDFYKKHSVDPDRMLVLSLFGVDAYELRSLGGDWQIVRDDIEKLKKLHEYQKEMNLFANFLTDYYLNCDL